MRRSSSILVLSQSFYKSNIEPFWCSFPIWLDGSNKVNQRNHKSVPQERDFNILSIMDVKQPHNTMTPVQNGWHVVDSISKCIFSKGNLCFLTEIQLKFVPWGSIDNVITGPDNGLAPNKQHPITWICVDQNLWCSMLSEGHSEFIFSTLSESPREISSGMPKWH